MQVDVSRRTLLAALFCSAAAGAANATPAGRLRLGRSTRQTLGVSPAWNETAGSGYQAPYYAKPTQAPIVNAFPVGNLLTADWRAYTSDLLLCVDAGDDETAYVQFYAEGERATVLSPRFHTTTDANGATVTRYGFGILLEWASTRAQGPTGCVEVYAEKIPIDPTMTPHLIGPFYFYPRLPSTDMDAASPVEVGPTYEFDKLLKVDKTGGTTPNEQYPNVIAALTNLRTNQATWLRPCVTIVSSGDHVFSTSLASATGARDCFTVLRVKAGVSATLGDGSANRQLGYGFDALELRGSNFEADLIKISPALTAVFRLTTGNRRIRFNGCRITATANIYLNGSGSGSGCIYDGTIASVSWLSKDTGTLRAYFEDVIATDIPQYGPVGAQLLVGGSWDTMSGTAIENITGSVHGVTVSRVDAVLAGLRTPLDAMTAYYDGAGVGTISISGNVGGSRTITLKVDGATVHTVAPSPLVTSIGSYPYTTPNTTKVAAVVADINAFASGWSAVEHTQDRAAMYLTKYNAASPASPTTNAVVPTTGAGGLLLSTFIDVHADLLFWHGFTPTNVRVTMCRFIATNSSHISISWDGPPDGLSIEWVEIQSISEDYPGFAGYSGSYLQSPNSKHLVIRRCSEMGGNQFFSSNDGSIPKTFSGDAYTKFELLSWQALVYSTGYVAAGAPVPAANITIGGIAVLYQAAGLITGAVGSVMQANGVTDADLYADVGVNPDFTPSTLLLHASGPYAGQYAGSRNNLGRWNGANYS